MKKICAIALVTLTFNAFSEDEVEKFKAEMSSRYDLLDNEIRVVKMKDFMKASIRNSEDKKMMMRNLAQMKRTKKDMDEKGYTIDLGDDSADLTWSNGFGHPS